MDKEELITGIVEAELAIFLAVPSVGGPASCQQDPDRFRIMWAVQFAAWSETTLSLYREDLLRAQRGGRNLLTEKYARMDGLLGPVLDNPLIREIVRIQLSWQRDLARRYPAFMNHGRNLTEDSESNTSFATYLAGELATYSAGTLVSLMADIQVCLDRGGTWPGPYTKAWSKAWDTPPWRRLKKPRVEDREPHPVRQGRLSGGFGNKPGSRFPHRKRPFFLTS